MNTLRSSPHVLDPADIESYEFRHQIAGAFGSGEHKAIYAIVRGQSVTYAVEAHREVILETAEVVQAVEAYNSIPRTLL